MTNTPDLQLHVSMLGPSRVGKTSLLTALMRDGERYFRGKPVTVEPADEATLRAFQRSDDLMTGELAAGRFSPNSLPGDSAHVQYRLRVKPLDDSGVTVVFHDFPGGWLETERRKEVESTLRKSAVVIVPVDATMLMEAGRLHRPDAHRHLQLSAIRQQAGSWATARRADGMDATLVISPVKCESYFADNGGSRDRSPELLDLVRDTYRDVIDAVVGEFDGDEWHRARILYMPVDTIGPIDIIETTWRNGMDGGPADMMAEYAVRMGAKGKPASRKIKGAEPLLADLMNMTLDLYRGAAQGIRMELESTHQFKVDEFQARGIFEGFFDWVSGRDREKQGEIGALQHELWKIEEKLGKLDALVTMKPSDSEDRRTRILVGV